MKNRNDRREEMGAYGTMIIIGLLVIYLAIMLITRL
jgi:hypothetical protein